MKKDESNWFAKWEDELPSPNELMPLNQTLISPDLAQAFNIQNPQNFQNPVVVPQTPNSGEFESSELNNGVGSNDDQARTLKRPRLVWTPQLHKRFVDAVAHLGIKNAVPKTIMQLMSVDGLTRENVASHLQKYRLYLKRMQGISSGGGDAASDHLFASSPVPAQFFQQGRPGLDHFVNYVQVAPVAAQQYPTHQRLIGAENSQFPTQFGQIDHFGIQPSGQVEHPFLARPQQGHNVHRLLEASSYVDDIDSGTHANGRKVLTLFPTGDD